MPIDLASLTYRYGIWAPHAPISSLHSTPATNQWKPWHFKRSYENTYGSRRGLLHSGQQAAQTGWTRYEGYLPDRFFFVNSATMGFSSSSFDEESLPGLLRLERLKWVKEIMNWNGSALSMFDHCTQLRSQYLISNWYHTFQKGCGDPSNLYPGLSRCVLYAQQKSSSHLRTKKWNAFHLPPNVLESRCHSLG